MDYVYIYVMILGFLFFIQTFLKHCKALSTEKYKRYINILLFFIIDMVYHTFYAIDKKFIVRLIIID